VSNAIVSGDEYYGQSYFIRMSDVVVGRLSLATTSCHIFETTQVIK